MSSGFDALLQELIGLQAPAPLIKQVAEMDASEVRKWIESVDESPYSVAEWAEALIRFADWERAHRSLPLKQKREYLCCCVEGTGGASSLLPLMSMLGHYLDTHGVRD